jgi:WD40 repeat protein
LSGSEDKTVKLWKTQTGKCLKTLTGHSNSVDSANFSTDSLLIVTGSDDKTVKLWKTQTGECLKTFSGHTDFVRSVNFSTDN